MRSPATVPPAVFLPNWIRRTRVSRVPNGRYFQAVRVPYERALKVLEDHPDLAHGPVVINPFARIAVFLLPRGTRPGQWTVPRTRFLRPGATVEIPPAVAVGGPDIHWPTPPTHQPYQVDDLITALTSPDTGPAGPLPDVPDHPRRQAA
ncbi:hypothetical protein BV309_34250 [Streptomyces clavuligerus]|nr:hypothetical protein [Streptomyces clavuligerus]